MIIVNSEGNENSLFNETKDRVVVIYEDTQTVRQDFYSFHAGKKYDEEWLGNFPSHFEKRTPSNNLIKFLIKKSNASQKNFCYVTKEKYNELTAENSSFYPFNDKKTRELVLVKNKPVSLRIGLDEDFTNRDYFYDRDTLSIEKMSRIEDVNNDYDFPFSFNYNNFFILRNRLDVFSNINKIMRNESTIDNLKGFKSNGIGKSKSAFGQNLNLTSSFEKSEEKTYHYEDNIISTYIYNNDDKIIIDKITRSLNPTTRLFTSNVITKKKNVITSDTRYIAYKEVNILPFVDRNIIQNDLTLTNNKLTNNKNDESLANKQNLFVFTDELINNTILQNANINNKIKESRLFSPRGQSYDYSTCNGQGSLLFREVLD